MKKLSQLFFSSCLACFLSCSTLLAQKPVTAQAWETGMPTEEAFMFFGNARISISDKRPLAIYQATFPVVPDTPEEMGRQFLHSQKEAFKLTDSDIDNLRLHAVRESDAGTTVRLRQYWKELPVNKSEITIHINPRNKVTYVANSWVPNIDLQDVTPLLTIEEARQTVINEVGITGNITGEKVATQIFATPEQAILVHRILIACETPHGEWEGLIDAKTGEIVQLNNTAHYYHKCRHKHDDPPSMGLPPFRLPTLVATGTANVFDPDPLSTANADYDDTGFPDNNDNNSTQLENELISVSLLDITFDGTDYILSGTYAEVQDFEAPNFGLFSQSSSTWDVDRSDNAFEAVNTYYHIDASMRYLNETLNLSITPTDYTTGVRFDPSGLGGNDNSYYSGGFQRLAFGEGGVDDAEDSDVIHHELGHGLHDWVTNGGLSQVDGLSEGCGDYWAASYNRFKNLWTDSDDPYYWVFNWDGHNPFWGGRSVNYSALYPGGLNNSIHANGQIWATCMMRIWDIIGREATDRIFWEGLGMTNGSSSQNDAANAVYQAALDLNYTYAQLNTIHDEMTATGYTLPLLPLPVTMSSFTAEKESQEVHLFWTTTSEINNDHFVVEKSFDGINFLALGRVEGNGNSIENNDYFFADKNPIIGSNFYRLKQNDFDGKFIYSEIIEINYSGENTISIYPNPTKNKLFIEGNLLNKNSQFTIYSTTGKVVDNQELNHDSEFIFSLNTSYLNSGFYFIKIQNNNDVNIIRFLKE